MKNMTAKIRFYEKNGFKCLYNWTHQVEKILFRGHF